MNSPHGAFNWSVTVARSSCFLSRWGLWRLSMIEGDFDAAERVLDESDAINDAIGDARIGHGRLTLAGLRGDKAVVTRLAAPPGQRPSHEAKVLCSPTASTLWLSSTTVWAATTPPSPLPRAQARMMSSVHRRIATGARRGGQPRCGRSRAGDVRTRPSHRTNAGDRNRLGARHRGACPAHLVAEDGGATELYVEAIGRTENRRDIAPEKGPHAAALRGMATSRGPPGRRAQRAGPHTTCSPPLAWLHLPNGRVKSCRRR